MQVALCSILLVLLGQPLGVALPGTTNPLELMYQPSLSVASPMGRTSLDSFHLRGAVEDMRLDLAFTQEGERTSARHPLQTMHFDSHGNLTEMVCYSPFEKDGAIEKYASYAIANQYDAQARLQHATLTATQQDMSAKIDAQRTYNNQGCLSAMDVVLTDLSTNTRPPERLKILMDFDAENRLAGQGLWFEEGERLQRISTANFHYEKNGMTLVESTLNTQGAVKQRQWFDAHGLLVEWHDCDAKGKAIAKNFIRYNTQGDALRISKYASGHWLLLACENYIYDQQGNWTARTINVSQRQNGKDIRLPEAFTQYRTLIYRT